MNVRFVILAPAGQKRSVSVRLPILVGRGDESKVRIQQDTVSRRHCEFFATGDEVFVRDLGSTNGTLLDDEPIPADAAVRVPTGAVVRLGNVAFRVEYASTAPARQEPPADNDTVPLPAAPSAEAGDDSAAEAEATDEAGAGLDWSTAEESPPAADDENLNDFFKSLS
jgi:pSer/pThr/pTyr-binding forkhead associated (FHA) protein